MPPPLEEIPPTSKPERFHLNPDPCENTGTLAVVRARPGCGVPALGVVQRGEGVLL